MPSLFHGRPREASAILAESTLSFLGLGLVNEPSWGQMLSQAVGASGFYWWIATFPGGAIFLTVIAIIPIILSSEMNIPFQVSQFFGGTSMLIMVGVMLDTMRQVESHLLMRHYDGFLKKGKLRGRF